MPDLARLAAPRAQRRPAPQLPYIPLQVQLRLHLLHLSQAKLRPMRRNLDLSYSNAQAMSKDPQWGGIVKVLIVVAGVFGLLAIIGIIAKDDKAMLLVLAVLGAVVAISTATVRTKNTSNATKTRIFIALGFAAAAVVSWYMFFPRP